MAKKAKAKSKRNNAKNNNLMMWVFVVLFLLIVISIAVILTLNNANPNLNDDFFVSDGSKYVVVANVGNYGDDKIVAAYDVYYHNNDTITGHEAYYEFVDEEMAQAALPSYRANKDEEVDKIELNGKYIVLTATPKQYEGLTLDLLASGE
jgi:hypothetical protein